MFFAWLRWERDYVHGGASLPDQAATTERRDTSPLRRKERREPPAKKARKPVFVDFYADWCKNCVAMEKTTFQEPDVKKRFEGYEFVKIDATNTNDPEIQKLLKLYDIKGLPAFLILKAK